MEIRDYARLLRRVWPLIVVLVVLGAAAGAALGAVRAPQYSSTVQTFVSVRSADSLADLTSGASYTQEAVASYADIATTAYVLEPVIERLGLDETPAELASSVTATAASSAAVLEITVEDSSAGGAARTANAIAAQLGTAVIDLAPDGATSAKTSVKLTVVDPAVAAAAEGPSTTFLAVGGGAVGLVLAAIVALLIELLNTRVRDQEDLSRVVDAPLLGVTVQDSSVRRRPLVVRDAPRSPQAEVYRSIRTNLRFAELDGVMHSLVVTSSIEGEGKSTTAANLAASVAGLGQRVLLVDADLRRPRVASIFDVDGAVGLTDVLLGDVPLEHATQTSAVPGLDLLPAGTIPPNPNEQLQSRAMRSLVERLHEEYDLVVFDSAPLLAVSDAAVLATLTSGALLVGASRKVRRRQVAAALETLDQANVRVLGVVLTMAGRRDAGEHGYGYGYGVVSSSRTGAESRQEGLAGSGSSRSALIRRDAR